MTEQTMWAVKACSGNIDTDTIRWTRSEAIRAFTSQYAWPWKTMYRDGARCVRVTVREVGDA